MVVPKHPAGPILDCKDRKRRLMFVDVIVNAGRFVDVGICVDVRNLLSALQRRTPMLEGQYSGSQCPYKGRSGSRAEICRKYPRNRLDAITQEVLAKGPVLPDILNDAVFAEGKELRIMLQSKSLGIVNGSLRVIKW